MERSLVSNRAPAGEDSARDLQDFDSLVELYRPRIFRFLLASLRDRESAENLTQDCFVRAYQARDQFRGAASVGTWLMQIAAVTGMKEGTVKTHLFRALQAIRAHLEVRP